MPMPTIEKRGFSFRYIIYVIIVLVCIMAIGITLYKQYFKDEKFGVIWNILVKKNKMEDEDDLISLKENFLNLNIFNNNLYIINQYDEKVSKIREEQELLFSETINQQDKNYVVDIHIPYFNINSDVTRKMNNEIRSTFKDKYESVIKSTVDKEIIYNVRYTAYIQNNILSLVILSELKESDSNQRLIIQTFNYDLINDKEVTIDEFIKLKHLDTNYANDKIKEEIKKSQEQNLKLLDMGYNVQIREYNSDNYKINNATQFFLGEKGYLYVIYAYGNTEMTSEMNIIIFK